jgi:hypothetical protein
MKIPWPSNLLAGLLNNNPYHAARMPALADVAAQARRERLDAQNFFNATADHDLVDHAIYLMLAAEKKYSYLIRRARQEGVTRSLFRITSSVILAGAGRRYIAMRKSVRDRTTILD